MVLLYDITEWNEQSWWNTGGTRDKKIYLNPEDNQLYYFKQSFKKGQRDYRFEFWSEIIASQIGLLLKLDILEYHIAIRGTTIGCISKSMIRMESEELVEGGKYLQAYDNTFNPENNKLRKNYDFDLILECLLQFGKENYIDNIIATIVFDALIGNSDRHQENWAIINIHSGLSEIAKIGEEAFLSKENEMPSFLKKFFRKHHSKGTRLMLPKTTRFAPIYDSGCSFGRELSEETIVKYLSEQGELQKYIEKGKAEIHWKKNKISHFDLMENLLQTEFKLQTINTIKNIIDSCDMTAIASIIHDVDKSLLNQGGNFCSLPQARKEFIINLLTLRLRKLNEIYQKYI